MKKCINGIIYEMTPEEVAEIKAIQAVPYKEQIVSAIREKYSIDDELAILRQRDTKPEEFEEYFNFVESVKQGLKKDETEKTQESENEIDE